MNQTDQLNDVTHKWPDGWHLDLDYQLPRVVFRKGSSTCYMYDFKDFDAHVKTCGITTLEYLEGKSFYRDHCIQLLKKRMENRLPVSEHRLKEINKHA